MWTFVKTAAVIAAMLLIVPLSVWAGSGHAPYARYAFRQYLLAMAIMTIPACVFSLIVTAVMRLS